MSNTRYAARPSPLGAVKFLGTLIGTGSVHAHAVARVMTYALVPEDTLSENGGRKS